MLRAINASLFIEDHHGNLEAILKSSPQIPCLLFGQFPWNRSKRRVSSSIELMSHEQWKKAGLTIPSEEIVEGSGLFRTKGWEDVVRWVKEWDRE